MNTLNLTTSISTGALAPAGVELRVLPGGGEQDPALVELLARARREPGAVTAGDWELVLQALEPMPAQVAVPVDPRRLARTERDPAGDRAEQLEIARARRQTLREVFTQVGDVNTDLTIQIIGHNRHPDEVGAEHGIAGDEALARALATIRRGRSHVTLAAA